MNWTAEKQGYYGEKWCIIDNSENKRKLVASNLSEDDAEFIVKAAKAAREKLSPEGEWK